MKLLSFAALATGLLVSGNAWAQVQAQTQRIQSEAPTAEQRLAEDIGVEQLSRAVSVPLAPNANNFSVLQQIGNGNAATVNQQNAGSGTSQAVLTQFGTTNALDFTQTGSRNTAEFTQDGQNLKSTVAQQGNNNNLTGVVQGNDTEVNLRQQGDNNQLSSAIRENGRVYNLSQYGNNNSLIQRETTSQTPKGYDVEMRGNGIRMTIEQGRVLP